VPSKATRSQHYLNIAEFYGRMLVEDLRDPRIPDFVLAHAARRTAHFALVGMRLAERGTVRAQPTRPLGVEPGHYGPRAFQPAISVASPS